MSKKNEPKKCQYSHCKHHTKIILPKKEKYVEENGRYYHEDCKHEKDTIYEIKDYWYNHIDKNVVFAKLTRIVNRLIYDESYDCDYVLWALKKKAKYLNFPPGLVYAVNDKKLKEEWDFEQKLKKFNADKVKLEAKKSDEPKFTYNDNGGKKKFSDIFGGA